MVKDKIDISLYFRQEVPEADVLEAQSYLSSLPEVRRITYVSSEEALKAFRQLHQSEAVVVESLEELDKNPLGSTLVVTAKSTEHFSSIIQELENSKYNALILSRSFDDYALYIDRINDISSSIRSIGLATSALFTVISLLIVFNTIRVAIYTHRREIAIMKLVGATNGFIISPFLLESILYGVIGVAIGVLLIFPIVNFTQPYINAFFQTSEFVVGEYFQEQFWQIFGLELLTIILLNIISSAVAIRRYLRV